VPLHTQDQWYSNTAFKFEGKCFRRSHVGAKHTAAALIPKAGIHFRFQYRDFERGRASVSGEDDFHWCTRTFVV